jgi:hypothetical protein
MVVVVLIASFACSEGEQNRVNSVVTDSSGVRIVTHGGPDLETEFEVSEVALLVPPDSAMMAFPWSVAADPRLGQIYIADQTAPRVLVFGESGQYVRTLGREGEGPSELVSPNAVAVTPSGQIAVWDVGRNVISRWSADGHHAFEESAPVSYWGPGFALEPEAVVTVTSNTAGTVMDQQLVRLSGGSTAVLHSVTRQLDPVELPCGTFPISPIYAPSPVWTHDGDAVHVLKGPGYRIDRFVGGNLVESVRRDLAPVRVTEAVATARVEIEYAGFVGACGLTPASLAQLVGFVEFTSPVQVVSIDPDRRMWVSRTLDGAPPIQVDVFSEDRQYGGTVSMNAMPVAWLSPSRFVGFAVQPDTGETLVTIQELVPRSR